MLFRFFSLFIVFIFVSSCNKSVVGDVLGNPVGFGSPSPSPTATVATPTPDVSPPPGSWTSSLYPANWTPGFTDSEGRFLHDFSYAGYHWGETPIPTTVSGQVINVTASPYNADPTGQRDSTQSIQDAINQVSGAGGGTVYLPPGTYKVSPQGNNPFSLAITSSHVLLKGAGPNQTYIFNSSTEMREKCVIRVSPDPSYRISWYYISTPKSHLQNDYRLPTKTLKVDDVSQLAIGQWVVIKADATPEFIADHGMTGKWDNTIGGVVFLRKIISIDSSKNEIEIDTPTRYYLLQRDHAAIYEFMAPLEEVGLQDFSIGMANVRSRDLDDNAYNNSGTVSYAVHQSHAITINHSVNSWIKNVSSFKPTGNSEDFHILSNAIHLVASKNVTVENVNFQKLEYQGAGGNGYAFIHQGSENIFVNAYAEKSRHNFDHSGLEATGNVILESTAKNSRLPSDFHMYLSPANLVDSVEFDGDYMSAVYRDTATPKHGHGTTQSVLWNLKGNNPQDPWKHNYLVETQQFGHGYVIGTSGRTSTVKANGGNNTEPIDFTEGVGQGSTLWPKSLYRDQLRRRLTHTSVRRR